MYCKWAWLLIAATSSVALAQRSSDNQSEQLARYRKNFHTEEGLKAFDECVRNPPRTGRMTCASIASGAEIEANKRKQEQQLSEQREAQRLASNDAVQKQQDKEAAIAKCESENASTLAQMRSANQLLSMIAMKQLLQQQIDNDKAAEKISGVADLTLRHNAGTGIVEADQVIAQAFEDYKQSGGTAQIAGQVTEIADPCASVR